MKPSRSDRYEWYTIEALPPKKEGGRHIANKVTRFSAPTIEGLWPMVEAYLNSLPIDKQPEGHGVLQVKGGVRKQVSGKWHVYPHGPLGWMNTSYMTFGLVHGLECRKCERIREHMDVMYPGMHPQDVMRTVPGRDKWEYLESIAREEPHSAEHSVKWAALDPR